MYHYRVSYGYVYLVSLSVEPAQRVVGGFALALGTT